MIVWPGKRQVTQSGRQNAAGLAKGEHGMHEGDVVEILKGGFYAALVAGGPAILAAMATGLVVSILQTLTQIQEATLAAVPKIVVTMMVTMLFMPFGFAALRTYFQEIMHLIVGV